MKIKAVWIGIFLLILLLTQINVFFDFSPKPWLLGFPVWLWWFVGVHGLFIFALY